MSTTPSALSAGLQALYNNGLLPSNLTPAEPPNASPAQLTQLSISNADADASAALFGDSGSASSDSVALSANVLRSACGESTKRKNAALSGSVSVSEAEGRSTTALFSYLG